MSDISLILLLMFAIGLIIAGIAGLAASNGKPDEKWIDRYDEEAMDRLIIFLADWEKDDDDYYPVPGVC